MSTTLLQLVKGLAKELGADYFVSGTIDSAASTSLTDADRTESDVWFQGGHVVLETGTNSGLAYARRISTNARSNTTVSLRTAWATTPSVGVSYFIVRPPLTVPLLVQSLNQALQSLRYTNPQRYNALYRPSRRGTRLQLESGVEVEQVLIGPSERLTNPDWRHDDDGWTLHANSSLQNTVLDNAAVRVLRHVASASDEVDYTDVAVTGGEVYNVGASVRVASGGNSVAVNFQWLDTSGTALNSTPLTLTGSPVTVAAWTGVSYERAEAPENAATLRLRFVSSSGTFYVRYATVAESDPWVTLAGCRPEPDGSTRYLVLPYPVDRDVRVLGTRPWRELSEDTDTVDLDDQRLRVLYAAAAVEVWDALSGLLSTADTAGGQRALWTRKLAERKSEVPGRTVAMQTAFRQGGYRTDRTRWH